MLFADHQATGILSASGRANMNNMDAQPCLDAAANMLSVDRLISAQRRKVISSNDATNSTATLILNVKKITKTSTEEKFHEFYEHRCVASCSRKSSRIVQGRTGQYRTDEIKLGRATVSRDEQRTALPHCPVPASEVPYSIVVFKSSTFNFIAG